MSQNTELHLMYRDADNYKTSQVVVVAGAITQTQIETIRAKLDDGVFAITQQVGLPTPAEQLQARVDFPTEADHVWTTFVAFAESELTPERLVTDKAPTIALTVEELVERFAEVEWDEAEEVERLGIPADDEHQPFELDTDEGASP